MNQDPLAEEVVVQTTNAIVERSADGVVAVTAGLVVGPALGPMHLSVPGTGPGFASAIDTLATLLREQITEEAFEDVVDQVPGRMTKLVVRGIGRSRRLLDKILGGRRDDMAAKARELAATGACEEGKDRSIVAVLMADIYDRDDVVNRGSARLLSGAADRKHREDRLGALQRTNERWICPVKVISKGLGPMWALPMPSPIGPVPAAPVVGFVLLVWDVFVSGDHLDARGPFSNFWKGVVRRSDGE
jgi:hypothetical protein